MTRMAFLVGIGMAFSALASATQAEEDGVELKVGDEAPAFELPGSDGQTYKLSDFKGKRPVVIAWYPKAFTPGCTKECKSFAESDELAAADVAYFTASCDAPDVNQKFAESLDAQYPILSDPEKNVARAYGVVHGDRQVPERWTFYIGVDGRILFVDKEVKTATHADDVVAKLKELGAKGAEK